MHFKYKFVALEQQIETYISKNEPRITLKYWEKKNNIFFKCMILNYQWYEKVLKHLLKAENHL
jgi:hypothetical protein